MCLHDTKYLAYKWCMRCTVDRETRDVKIIKTLPFWFFVPQEGGEQNSTLEAKAQR